MKKCNHLFETTVPVRIGYDKNDNPIYLNKDWCFHCGLDWEKEEN